MNAQTDVKNVVREKYGQAATRAAQGKSNSCCGGASGAIGNCDPITSNLYDSAQADDVPEKALLASLGCGNPTALAELKAGETVLDLGSGGGIDVLLSARRVGPTGRAFGLDMTDQMLALAEENKRKSGLENVHFLKGEIEHIPLPDNSVDVIISNCVINLSGDKDRVLQGSLPRAQARRPLCGVRRRRARRRTTRHPQEHGVVGRVRGRCVVGHGVPGTSSPSPALRKQASKSRACTRSTTRANSWPASAKTSRNLPSRSKASSSVASSAPSSRPSAPSRLRRPRRARRRRPTPPAVAPTAAALESERVVRSGSS